LDAIWDYIGIENHHPAAADRLLDTFCEKSVLLAAHPLIGEQRPDLDDLVPGVRAFAVGNYVIYYQPAAAGVRIVRVLHGARDARSAIRD
jgi:toxin ParE1/3/4